MQKLNLNSNSNDEYLNELRKNKELAGIDVNINNCNLLSRYLSDLEHCKKCRGLRMSLLAINQKFLKRVHIQI